MSPIDKGLCVGYIIIMNNGKEHNMFNCYFEIPALTVSYLLSVADADSITDIPLEEINGFLAMLENQANETEYMAQFN